jgi:hypothetical protein
VAAGLAACGGSSGGQRTASTRTAATTPRPRPAPAPDPAFGGGLAVGLTETNANLIWHGRDVGAFGPWRDRVEAIRPTLFRLLVDWAQLQPSPAVPPAWTKPDLGCARGVPPCGPFSGLRDVLRAVRSQQEAGRGFEVLVSIYGVPAWAARPPAGCERPGTTPRSRPITAAGLRAYGALVDSLQALAAAERVRLRWWSPWNEPNGPYFLSPQRSRCTDAAPLRSPAVYAELARALRARLRPGQGLVVGDLADLRASRPGRASVADFVAALPDDVLCSAVVVAQHDYVEASDPPGARGAVGQLEDALDHRPCAASTPIWVTETGVGAPRTNGRRTTDPATLRAECRALQRALRRWDADPRVGAAFQYTFRDDPAFPVGLADARLTRAFPVEALWRAWGGDRAPDGPAPALPAACK